MLGLRLADGLTDGLSDRLMLADSDGLMLADKELDGETAPSSIII